MMFTALFIQLFGIHSVLVIIRMQFLFRTYSIITPVCRYSVCMLSIFTETSTDVSLASGIDQLFMYNSQGVHREHNVVQLEISKVNLISIPEHFVGGFCFACHTLTLSFY